MSDNNQSNNPQPNVLPQSMSQGASSKRPTIKSAKTLLAGLIVVAAVIAGYLYWNSHQSQNYSYTYSGSETYNVPGSAKGRGLTFNKPSVFPAAAPNENTKATRGFEQLMSNKKIKSPVVISRLLVTATDRPVPSSTAFLKAVTSAMASPSGSDYANVVRNAQIFANGAFDQVGRKLSFSNAQTFSDNFVQANAWKFNLTFVQPSGVTPDQKGELVYLIGKNTAYYFLITATNSNWSSNSQFFQGVLNSIKIDQ